MIWSFLSAEKRSNSDNTGFFLPLLMFRVDKMLQNSFFQSYCMLIIKSKYLATQKDAIGKIRWESGIEAKSVLISLSAVIPRLSFQKDIALGRLWLKRMRITEAPKGGGLCQVQTSSSWEKRRNVSLKSRLSIEWKINRNGSWKKRNYGAISSLTVILLLLEKNNHPPGTELSINEVEMCFQFGCFGFWKNSLAEEPRMFKELVLLGKIRSEYLSWSDPAKRVLTVADNPQKGCHENSSLK